MQGSKRNIDVKNRLLDYVGEGKGGIIWENRIETHILPYVKQMTCASSMNEAGHSSQYSGTILRDGVEREVGGGSGWRDNCALMAASCWCMARPPQYCKLIILQLKYIFKTNISCFISHTINGFLNHSAKWTLIYLPPRT